MALVLTNNASALLSGSIDGVVTQLAVGSGAGSLFPALSGDDWFPLVVRDSGGGLEIMRATAHTGDVITVTRGQEGSSARSFTAGARVDCRLTEAAIAGIITDLETYADASVAAAVDDLEGKLSAPAGTRLQVQQDAAPDGWTIDTANNNAAARIVSGSPGTGGSMDFTSAFASRVIAKANLPSYDLSISSLSIKGSPTLSGSQSGGMTRNFVEHKRDVDGRGRDAVVKGVSWSETIFSVSKGSLDVGGSLSSGGSGTPMDFAVKYVDFIIIEKD